MMKAFMSFVYELVYELKKLRISVTVVGKAMFTSAFTRWGLNDGRKRWGQAKIKRRYLKAVFVHCAVHRLNVAINDLNSVPEIGNSIGVIKAITNCLEIVQREDVFQMCLCCASLDGLQSTKAYGLFMPTSKKYSINCAYWLPKTQVKLDRRPISWNVLSSATFLVSLVIISSCSARLEPVTQELQAVQLDILKVCNHIQDLLPVFRCHRQNAEERFKDIFTKVKKLAERLSFDLRLPRQCSRQAFRANVCTPTVEKYFCKSIFVPYLDSVIYSLESRFSAESKQCFSLFLLYPKHMIQMNEKEYMKHVEDVKTLYNVENLEAAAATWFEMWREIRSYTVELERTSRNAQARWFVSSCPSCNLYCSNSSSNDLHRREIV